MASIFLTSYFKTIFFDADKTVILRQETPETEEQTKKPALCDMRKYGLELYDDLESHQSKSREFQCLHVQVRIMAKTYDVEEKEWWSSGWVKTWTNSWLYIQAPYCDHSESLLYIFLHLSLPSK